jgi:hypothetical protein
MLRTPMEARYGRVGGLEGGGVGEICASYGGTLGRPVALADSPREAA